MHDDRFRELVEDAADDLWSTASYWAMRLASENGGYNNRDLWETLVEPCPGCGRVECTPDCDWGHCPGPGCDFEGHLHEHVDWNETGSTTGYAGGRVYYTRFRCGFYDVDESDDVMAAV